MPRVSRRTGVIPTLRPLPSLGYHNKNDQPDEILKTLVGVDLEVLQPTFEEYRASKFYSMYPDSSYPEFLVWHGLIKNRLKEGEDFQYQVPELGIYIRESGSTVVDFLVIAQSPYLALPVQGIYYHPTHGEIFEKDKLIMTRLKQEEGLEVIPLDEDDLLANALWLVKEALSGRDHSRYVGLI
jgi:hypothetical protein